MRIGHSPNDDGSLTVELVALAPVLFLLALTMVVFGRVTEARQQVVESSRAAAEIASVLPNAPAAESAAAGAVSTGDLDRSHYCPTPRVTTDVSHFFAGGYVTVTVVCQVDLSDLSVPGIPGSTTVRASSTAPIDPYRSVQ
jgi:Flp pilus assembly protein TadG